MTKKVSKKPVSKKATTKKKVEKKAAAKKVKKSESTVSSEGNKVDLVTVKVSRNVGLRCGKRRSTDSGVFENVFMNIDDDKGSHVQMKKEDADFVREATKNFLKAQELLEDAFGLPVDYKIMNRIQAEEQK